MFDGLDAMPNPSVLKSTMDHLNGIVEIALLNREPDE